MNAQRFIAPNSREAMALARATYGDSAVILSSRSTEQGFEVVATAEEHLDQLASQSAPRAAQAPAASTRQPLSLEQRAARNCPTCRPTPAWRRTPKPWP
jgi:flagellar biosynthesis protein FlhF